jgi:acetyl-CoA carboxylase biotin carboxyl carrier protein
MSDGPDLTPEDVKEILRLIDDSRFDEFELETPRLSIRFSRGGDPAAAAPTPASAAASTGRAAKPDKGLVEVTSPMVGTLYRSPAPGEPAFVEPGSRVEPGSLLCIIEVMKLMNAVAAEVAGTIEEACFESGSPVQYGNVLFRIRTDA